jgi:hypothetical protein
MCKFGSEHIAFLGLLGGGRRGVSCSILAWALDFCVYLRVGRVWPILLY